MNKKIDSLNWFLKETSYIFWKSLQEVNFQQRINPSLHEYLC